MTNNQTNALRRLGAAFVACDVCTTTMREPDDPFEGPNVMWITTPEDPKPHGKLLYVCGPRCRRKVKEGAAT
jgi:hypothetical protein